MSALITEDVTPTVRRRFPAVRWSATALLVLAASLAVPAYAQTIYKSIQRDGRVVYSDRPVPGARVERVDPAQSTLSIVPNPRARVEQATSAAVDQRLLERQMALDRADAEVRAATIALESAQARLEAGQVPLPGEITGNVGGTTRLNDLYQGRVVALQQQLLAAQERLDAAYAARNQAR